jgi:hypothetical protein
MFSLAVVVAEACKMCLYSNFKNLKYRLAKNMLPFIRNLSKLDRYCKNGEFSFWSFMGYIFSKHLGREFFSAVKLFDSSWI